VVVLPEPLVDDGLGQLCRREPFGIENLTPADAYFGRGRAILKQRERIKLKTTKARPLQYRKYAA